MITRPASENAFEFVTIVALRAAQLMRGCTSLVPAAEKPIVTAQREVAGGLVRALPRAAAIALAFDKPALINNR